MEADKSKWNSDSDLFNDNKKKSGENRKAKWPP